MTVFPGQTIGILGGGQLGRMTAIAARRMGYRVDVLDPTADCPTAHIADLQITAPYDDIPAAQRLARDVDVVTFEFENVPAETLAAIQDIRPVHPSPFVLETTRHRLREKDFLSSRGFPVAPYRAARSLDELRWAIGELGTPCILKTADYGYDGKGQVRIDRPEQADEAWRAMGRPVGVLEGFVKFEKEISVIVARNAWGEVRSFPVAENLHTRHILDLTLAPARLEPAVADAAQKLSADVAAALDVVGLLAVELFLVGSDQLVINELAPRPHNSGHFSFDACVTSQFEQHVRAVCGLPLGDPSLLRPAAMANLLGELWQDGKPDWAAALRLPSVKLHLYGKLDAKPGRKMGHLTATDDTVESARDLVLRAREALVARR